MSSFQTVRDQIAAQLKAAGVEQVSTDRAQVPPMVLVGMPTGTGTNQGAGRWECTFPITIVQLPPGDTANAAWMLDQLERCLITLGAVPFRPTTWGDDQVPAYQLTHTRNVPNPNC